MSSKAISMASGMPVPHQDLLPVIGAIDPMYKGLPRVVKLSGGKLTASRRRITPCAAKYVNVTIHLVKAKSILQRECYSGAVLFELNTSIFFSKFYRFLFDVTRISNCVGTSLQVRTKCLPKTIWREENVNIAGLFVALDYIDRAGDCQWKVIKSNRCKHNTATNCCLLNSNLGFLLQ